MRRCFLNRARQTHLLLNRSLGWRLAHGQFMDGATPPGTTDTAGNISNGKADLGRKVKRIMPHNISTDF